jgi:hypothetical protein
VRALFALGPRDVVYRKGASAKRQHSRRVRAARLRWEAAEQLRKLIAGFEVSDEWRFLISLHLPAVEFSEEHPRGRVVG